MLTKREIFEIVSRHLQAQQKPARESLQGGGACRYHGHGGLRCAIGCLIPETESTDKIEGFSIYSITEKEGTAVVAEDDTKPVFGFDQMRRGALRKEFQRLLPQIDLGDISTIIFLCALQGVHDTTPVERWMEELKSVEERFL